MIGLHRQVLPVQAIFYLRELRFIAAHRKAAGPTLSCWGHCIPSSLNGQPLQLQNFHSITSFPTLYLGVTVTYSTPPVTKGNRP